MEKRDTDIRMDRNSTIVPLKNNETVKKASPMSLKTRKIISFSDLRNCKPSDSKPTKAVFNLNKNEIGKGFVPFSGTLELKPQGASLDFFTGRFTNQNKVNQTEEKESDLNNNQKKITSNAQKKKDLFGEFIQQSGAGGSMFKNLVQKTEEIKSDKQEVKKESQEKKEMTKPSTEETGNTQNLGLFGKIKENTTTSIGFFGKSSFGNKSQSLFSNTNIPLKTDESSTTSFNSKQSFSFGNKKPEGIIEKKELDKIPQSSNVKQAKQKKETPNAFGGKGMFSNLVNKSPQTSGGLFGGLVNKPDEKKEGGLFANLAKNNNSGGLFSGGSSGLFSNKPIGQSGFFKTNNDDEVEDNDEEEIPEKEESVDENLVEKKFDYKDKYTKLISKNVTNFKVRLVGGSSADIGLGLGSVALEELKPENEESNEAEKVPDQNTKIIMFVFRNKAKRIQHQSMIIKGITVHYFLKSRKDGITILTLKNEEDKEGKITLRKYYVKILFGDADDAQEFSLKLNEVLKNN